MSNMYVLIKSLLSLQLISKATKNHYKIPIQYPATKIEKQPV
ncbi:MAG: hypothetical protein ACI8RD_005308 [Bacillariaceae sp.]|jgi:hypothetical protein